MDFGETPGTTADSSTKRAMLGNAAQAMAADIRTAMQTQTLTVSEKAQLMGVLTEMVGSAELAQAYVGQVMAGADAGTRAALEGLLGEIDSGKVIGDNGEQRFDGGAVNPRAVNGHRTSRYTILTQGYIEILQKEIEEIGADPTIFRFNQGNQTGFLDSHGVINVRGDVLPDLNSTHPRDSMSSKAVIVHEYYGHKYYNDKVGNKNPEPSSWNDEFRASYHAALYTPNLSNEDRMYLMM